MHARRIGHTQAGAKIMRISNAVQHQQQRRFVQHIQHIVDAVREHHNLDLGNNTLVTSAIAHSIQACVIHLQDPHLVQLGQLKQILQTCILALRRYIQLNHTIGVLPQARGDGVKAVDHACFRQSFLL
jgi:hypothetical protein